MTDKRTRTVWVASNPEVRVAGYAWRDRRQLIIVPTDGKNEVVTLDSQMLGADFPGEINRQIPSDLKDVVALWLAGLDSPSASE